MDLPDKFELARLIRHAPVVDREDFILQTCTSQRVLDLGCIRHDAEYSLKDPEWLHRKILSVARETIGVDYLPDQIALLNQQGYQVHFGDVTKPLAVNGLFDVIVAGDLIQNIHNFEGFFANLQRLLAPRGKVIVSAPNPFFANEFFFVALKSQWLMNPEQTCWIDPFALAILAQRFNFAISALHFTHPSWSLHRLVAESPRDRYDIFRGVWTDASRGETTRRRLIGVAFAPLFGLMRWITGGFNPLVRHANYLAILQRESDSA